MFEFKASVANIAWAAACQSARLRMKIAMGNPEFAQLTVLQRLLRANAGTSFGREHGLLMVRRVEEFQEAVPARSYDDLVPWIERTEAGERGVLTNEPVLAFERSSGSNGAAKMIPFTAGLRAEFQEAIRAWMGELYARIPSLMGGPAYWLVSPLKQPGTFTNGGIPIGFNTDAEYLGAWERRMSSWLFAVPQEIARKENLEENMDLTLRHLIRRPELRLISVWNPSYLTILWRRLIERVDEFIPSKSNRPAHPRDLWPRLAVVSGWANGSSEVDATFAAKLFDHATFQPKGLLATEGVITIPWGDGEGAVPALRSHFLEFLETGGGTIKLVHELEFGREYEVLLTTSGGLWRYRLGDVVRVVGHDGRTPRLCFMGRADGVCDLRGEKLHPRFVGDIISKLTSGFAMLAPADDAARPHYILGSSCILVGFFQAMERLSLPRKNRTRMRS
ncbi:GH3 auxin-responsive promoter family protein [soil metagenome]